MIPVERRIPRSLSPEHENVGTARNAGGIRASVVQCTPMMDGGASWGQWTKHGLSSIKIADAFQCHYSLVVSRRTVIEHWPKMALGNEFHTPILRRCLLQWHPNAQLFVINSSINAVRFILMPRCRRTVPRRLQDSVLKPRFGFRPE